MEKDFEFRKDKRRAIKRKNGKHCNSDATKLFISMENTSRKIRFINKCRLFVFEWSQREGQSKALACGDFSELVISKYKWQRQLDYRIMIILSLEKLCLSIILCVRCHCYRYKFVGRCVSRLQKLKTTVDIAILTYSYVASALNLVSRGVGRARLVRICSI
jgi:hypothetical protein